MSANSHNQTCIICGAKGVNGNGHKSADRNKTNYSTWCPGIHLNAKNLLRMVSVTNLEKAMSERLLPPISQPSGCVVASPDQNPDVLDIDRMIEQLNAVGLEPIVIDK